MRIERQKMNELIAWQNSSRRKPLIVRGVRQCGKTWLLKEFGRLHFKDTAYFNFERQRNLASLFTGTIDPERILMELGALAGKALKPQTTLIIFDEIQTSPEALNALKYFCEEKSEYAIAAAGSLLGVTLSAQVGFPVGKVNFMELTPCSFAEYLTAAEPTLADYCNQVAALSPLPEAFTQRLEKHLRNYLAFGGMPEVLTTFIETTDISQAEAVQQEILQSYELDFSKHAPVRDIPKLFLLWNSIPDQLARENAKFMYGEVKSGARAKDLEDALRWLLEAGLIHRINRLEQPVIPLTAYEDRRNFKLYLADTGILRKMAQVPVAAVLLNKDVFGEFKGRLVENYVQQHLYAMGINPVHYWTSGNTAEVDFIIQSDELVLPVEVKSGLNVRSHSMQVYRSKYNPKVAIRFSMQNLKYDNGLLNIPLYLIDQLPRLLKIISSMD